MSIVEILRSTTRQQHQYIENLPVSKSIISGSISRTNYISLIGHLYYIHKFYEFNYIKNPFITGSWPSLIPRSCLIIKDLKVLGGNLVELPDCILDWNRNMCHYGSAAVWLGACYVLEGSRLGSSVIIKPLARSLDIHDIRKGVGLDFHLNDNSSLDYWKRVIYCLDSYSSDIELSHIIIKGAQITFSILITIYELHST